MAIPSKEYCEKFYNRTLDMINQFKPDLLYFDDTALPGKFFLEILDTNKAFFEASEELKKLATDYKVTIVFKPE
ncbi:hypothetical protein DQQ10_00255 [Pseudochryseolinea flava]|uniref:Uncharacterized protein n=2 Tax=Pseudochryseolinea flava TaxID=2059302 RepID=A0A364Y665_9BACT|nr:hypothetical protein DQQ10_00255 [Pseudochryseolinea flava]